MTINRFIELPSEKPSSVSPDFCFSPVLSLPDTPEPVPLITPTIKTSTRGPQPPKVNYLEVLNDARDCCISQKFVPKPPSFPKPKKQVKFHSSPDVESADYSDDFDSDDGESKEKVNSPSKLKPSKTPPPTISHSPHCLTSMTGGDTVFSKKRCDDIDSADEVSDEEIEDLDTSSRPSSSNSASAASGHSDDLDSGSPAYPVFKSITRQPSRPQLKYRGRRIITNTQPLQITSYHEPMPPPKPPKGHARHQPWMTRPRDTPSKSPSKNAATLKQPHKPLNAKPQGSDNKAAQKRTNTLEILPPQPPKNPHPPPPKSNRRRDLTRRRFGQVPGTGKVTKAEGARRGRHD